MKSIGVILIAFGIGIFIAGILRGYVSDTISLDSHVESSRPVKILEGIWSPRKVYLNIKVYGGRADILLYSNGAVLKIWNNTFGFIDRVDIASRSYSYLLIIPHTKINRISQKVTFYGVEKDVLVNGFVIIILGIVIYIIGCVRRKELLIILIILFSSVILLKMDKSYAIPNWFNRGVYAKYKGRIEGEVLLLYNDTVISGNWEVYIYWRCIEINNDMAKLFINITLRSLDNISPTLSYIDYILLNISSRKVFYKGREIGITSMFLEEIPRENQKITLIKTENYEVIGTVDKIRIIPTYNFGFQKVVDIRFNISTTGTFINGSKIKLSYDSSLEYDVDTGILLKGGWTSDPIFLIIAGIKMMFLTPNIYLEETNVDIGPSDTAIEIQVWLGRTLFVLAIISPIIFVGYIIYKRKIKDRLKSKDR